MTRSALAFTGHRYVSLPYGITIEDVALNFVAKWGPSRARRSTRCSTLMLVGGALGADLAVLQWCYQLEVPYEIYLPFPADIFTAKWQSHDRLRLTRYIHRAVAVHVLGKAYDVGLYHARDRAMVDRAEAVATVWDGRTRGGTYGTIKYAAQQEKPIVNVLGGFTVVRPRDL